jgi:hypothetical protein
MKFNKAEKKELAEAKQLSRRLSSNLPKKIEAASLSYYSKLPFKAFSLREALIYRIAESKNGKMPLESYNILTAIDHTDKAFTGYRNAYNTLSEFAHPNWPGLLGAYSKLNRKKIHLELGKDIGNIPLLVALPLLVGALTLFIYYYNEMETYLLKFNEFCDKKYQKSNKNIE